MPDLTDEAAARTLYEALHRAMPEEFPDQWADLTSTFKATMIAGARAVLDAAAPSVQPAVGLLAWVGADELGSGELGIKRAFGGGYHGALALLSTQTDVEAKLTFPPLLQVLQQQADQFGNPLKLMRFVAVEVVQEVRPTSGKH